MTGTLHEDQYTFFVISRSVIPRMKNVSDKSRRENRNTHFFSSSENRAVYEIIWTNIVERSRPQMTIWRTSISRWIPKATNTHSHCVILITFPLHQVLHERVSILRLYIHCLSC